MAKNGMNKVVEYLRRAVLIQDGAGQSDGKLLGYYLEDRDNAAFEALVRRHGRMVMQVARRIVRNEQDAEDAFQSTFLVLVRKAASVTPREKLADWLYGVAQQTALRVRALNARRRGREMQLTCLPDPQAVTADHDDGLKALLDRELSCLAEKYRIVIVLCDLEGRTRQEVARQLGWPEGSVAGRLARGRALLAKRLTRRGLALSAEALAVMLPATAASACLPPALVGSTMKAAGLMAVGQTTAISANIVAIAEGVLTAMFLSKFKTLAVVSLLTAVLGVGLGTNYLAGQTTGKGAPVEEKNPDGPKSQPAAGNKPIVEEPNVANLQRRLGFLENQNLELKNNLERLNSELTRLRQSNNKPIQEAKPTDTSAVKTNDLCVFALKNIGAEEARTAICNLFENANLAEPKDKNTALFITVVESRNAVIVRGNRHDIDIIQAILDKLETLPAVRPSVDGPPRPAAASKKGKN